MQMIVVTTADWDAVAGRLERYERATPGKKWKAVGRSFAVVVGKSGLAWGSGIVPVAASLAGASDPVKKEGDGRAPAGVFRLTTAFGYAAEAQPGWKMPYLRLTGSVECVDDTNSRFYNRVLDRGTVAPDWNSSEHMLRPDELYRWGVVVDHNSSPTRPGAGSCIFLHIWRGSGIGTVGCTAMPREQLESLLGWLDPRRQPLLVELPASEYKRARRLWHLPAWPAER
jgi:L,D-peptidoglycan transpeptidase YkuD (ErfK/YbiS/YcfS/YnhG family)